MTVLWELEVAPRELHQKEMNIVVDPPRQEREHKHTGRGKAKQPATSVGAKSVLEPINEGPQHAQIKQDAATSTTNLAEQGSGLGQGQGDGGEAPSVHKAQIKALAMILSALRR